MSLSKSALTEAAKHYARFMKALGIPSNCLHSTDTPDRVARSMAEFTSGVHQDLSDLRLTVFPADPTSIDGLVVVKGIPFASICAHHHVPFHGQAAVGYLPDRSIIGLSKIPRLVDLYARRPQVQEELTVQIAQALMTVLKPRAVLVLLEAEHSCLSFRGAKKPGHRTITHALRGDALGLKSEFLALVRG